MNLAFTFDEWGNPLCPVYHVSWEYPEDDSVDHRLPERRLCGEDVMLLVEHAVPITPGDVRDPRGAGTDAVSSAWKVQCAAGHVLAVSDGEEAAEDFVWNEVFG
jgi:precorrin-6B methylase 2